MQPDGFPLVRWLVVGTLRCNAMAELYTVVRVETPEEYARVRLRCVAGSLLWFVRQPPGVKIAMVLQCR